MTRRHKAATLALAAKPRCRRLNLPRRRAQPAGRRRAEASGGVVRRPERLPSRAGSRRAERGRPERRRGLRAGRQGHEGRRAGRGRRRGRRRRGAPAAAAPGEAKPLRGPAAMLAQAMNESRSMPTATSFRTLPVDVLDAKRKALNGVLKDRGMKVSFTHLVAWAIVEAAHGVAGDGARLRGARRQAAGDRAGRRQPGDRGRRGAQGVAQPDGARASRAPTRSTSPPSTPTTRS